MLRFIVRNDAWTQIAYRQLAPSTTRCIATASAIHKGLRRTKGAPELSYAARPRGPRRDDTGGRDSERSERPRKKPKKQPTAKDLRPVGKRPISSFPKGSVYRAGRTGSESDKALGADFDRRTVNRGGSDDHGFKLQKPRYFRPQSRQSDGPRRASPREGEPDALASYKQERRSPYTNDRRADRSSDYKREQRPPYENDRRSQGLKSFRNDNRPSHRDNGKYERSESYRDRREREEDPKDEFEDHDQVERKPRKSNQISPAIEYTTPASEFLYGTSVVEAALKSSRRKLYKLYMLGGDKKRDDPNFWKMQQAAMKRGVPVKILDNTSLLDKMSAGRLNNGYVLEASPLMKPPIQYLLEVDGLKAREVRFEAGAQSDEDLEINGNDNQVKTQSDQPRYPFVIFLDGVQDTGNLGGILRTAHFLGVDAVVMSSTCAPLNAVVLKASAGAAENLPLMHAHDTTGFIEASRDNGWTFYASVPPPSSESQSKRRKSRHNTTDSMESPLPSGPCVLMIGGEGSGLKQDLIKKADATVSIGSHRRFRTTVDSLNVSVAMGMLANAFLNLPAATAKQPEKGVVAAQEDGELVVEHLERKEGEMF